MTRSTTSRLLLLSSVLALVLAAAACSGGSDSKGGDDDNGTPTPTPVVNPYDVCVAHIEQDVGDAPEIANLVLVVLLNEYWVGVAQDVVIDGLNGAIYADYHYNFDGAHPPEYVGAISTNAMVTITSTDNQLGTSASIEIAADPLWYLTTGTGSTLTGGAGTASGVLQALSDCTAGACVYGSGSASIVVNTSALTLSTTNADTVGLLYCRDLPPSFADWRPGRPLPPGFREAFAGSRR